MQSDSAEQSLPEFRDGLGPMQRWAVLVADLTLPSQIVQRVADGATLSEIARSLGLPKNKFLSWVAANGELSDTCRRVRELAGIELRFEGLDLVDGATPENIAVKKEQAKFRTDLSRDLNRPLFGKFTQHEHQHTVDLGERLRRARERVVDELPPLQVVPAAHELI